MAEPVNHPQPSDESIQIWTGCRVAVEFVNLDGSREKMAFQIVPDALSDFSRGYLAEGTRLAQALMGHKAGERLAYQADDIAEVIILGAALAESGPDESIAERREANLRKALRQTELANLIAFAASFNSKWGDYDPQSLTDEWEKDE
jgi:hypothetical protein